MNTTNRKRNTARRAGGSAALELCCGALVTLVAVAFSLNVCFAMISYNTNDRACRDAARAAAQGANLTEAQLLAQRVAATYNNTNAKLSPVTVTQVVYTDFNGDPPAGVSPTVTVTTQAVASLPFPLDLFGQKLMSTVIPVAKKYTFPIVRLTFHP